jgi:hypothetical protein
MKKVICINDENLPPEANIQKDQIYEVISIFTNSLDQKALILKGVNNEGRTKWGMKWFGYDSKRFRDLKDEELLEEVLSEAYFEFGYPKVDNYII